MAKFVLSAFADEAGSTLEEQIAALKDNDIDYIEPRNIGGKGILKLTEDELTEVKKALDEAGIKVNSLGSPIGKYDIDAPFEDHLADFEIALRACKILNTSNIRMFSFFVEQDQLKEKKEEVFSRLRKMCALAKESNIRLCHENESKIYGQMPEEVSELLTEIPELYGIFDAANYIRNQADVNKGMTATLQNLAYMHIKDAFYDGGAIVPAGEGDAQMGKMIDIVNGATDEVVYLTLEPHLHIFDAYKDIDDLELKGKHSFKNNREAFDFAANALKKVLIDQGYRKDANNQWIK